MFWIINGIPSKLLRCFQRTLDTVVMSLKILALLGYKPHTFGSEKAGRYNIWTFYFFQLDIWTAVCIWWGGMFMDSWGSRFSFHNRLHHASLWTSTDVAIFWGGHITGNSYGKFSGFVEEKVVVKDRIGSISTAHLGPGFPRIEGWRKVWEIRWNCWGCREWWGKEWKGQSGDRERLEKGSRDGKWGKKQELWPIGAEGGMERCLWERSGGNRKWERMGRK